MAESRISAAVISQAVLPVGQLMNVKGINPAARSADIDRGSGIEHISPVVKLNHDIMDLEYLNNAPATVKIEKLSQQICQRLEEYSNQLSQGISALLTIEDMPPVTPESEQTSDPVYKTFSSPNPYLTNMCRYVLFQLYYVLLPQQLQSIMDLNLIVTQQQENKTELLSKQLDNLADYTKKAMQHIINSFLTSCAGAGFSGVVSIGGTLSGAVSQYKSMQYAADVKLHEFDARVVKGQSAVKEYQATTGAIWSDNEIKELVTRYDTKTQPANGTTKLADELKAKTDNVEQINQEIKTDLANPEHPGTIRKDSLVASTLILNNVEQKLVGDAQTKYKFLDEHKEYDLSAINRLRTDHEKDMRAYRNLTELDSTKLDQLTISDAAKNEISRKLLNYNNNQVELYKYNKQSNTLHYLDFNAANGDKIVLRSISYRQNTTGAPGGDSYDYTETSIGDKAALPELAEFIDSRNNNLTYKAKNYQAVDFLTKLGAAQTRTEICYQHENIKKYHDILNKGIENVKQNPRLRLTHDGQQIPVIDSFKNGLEPNDQDFAAQFEAQHSNFAKLIKGSKAGDGRQGQQDLICSTNNEVSIMEFIPAENKIIIKDPVVTNLPVVRISESADILDAALTAHIDDKFEFVKNGVSAKAQTLDFDQAYVANLARADNQAKNLDANFKVLEILDNGGVMKPAGSLRQLINLHNESNKSKWQMISSLSMLSHALGTMIRDSMQGGAEIEQQKSRNVMSLGEGLGNLYQSMMSTTGDLIQGLNSLISQFMQTIIQIAQQEATGINNKS